MNSGCDRPFFSFLGGGDERGQSEVLGTILLVAIALVVAAAVGHFVFGLDIVQTDDQSVAPQVSFSTTQEGDELNVEHTGGDTLERAELSVVGAQNDPFDDDGTWSSGEEITIHADPGDTVRIVWEDSTTDDSAILLRYTFE